MFEGTADAPVRDGEPAITEVLDVPSEQREFAPPTTATGSGENRSCSEYLSRCPLEISQNQDSREGHATKAAPDAPIHLDGTATAGSSELLRHAPKPIPAFLQENEVPDHLKKTHAGVISDAAQDARKALSEAIDKHHQAAGINRQSSYEQIQTSLRRYVDMPPSATNDSVSKAFFGQVDESLGIPPGTNNRHDILTERFALEQLDLKPGASKEDQLAALSRHNQVDAPGKHERQKHPPATERNESPEKVSAQTARPAEDARFDQAVKAVGLTPERQARIENLIGQLSSESFIEREQASKALTATGVAAFPQLHRAVNDTSHDLEGRRRATQCIDSMINPSLPPTFEKIESMRLAWENRQKFPANVADITDRGKELADSLATVVTNPEFVRTRTADLAALQKTGLLTAAQSESVLKEKYDLKNAGSLSGLVRINLAAWNAGDANLAKANLLDAINADPALSNHELLTKTARELGLGQDKEFSAAHKQAGGDAKKISKDYVEFY